MAVVSQTAVEGLVMGFGLALVLTGILGLLVLWFRRRH
jgi:hypothetical protein